MIIDRLKNISVLISLSLLVFYSNIMTAGSLYGTNAGDYSIQINIQQSGTSNSLILKYGVKTGANEGSDQYDVVGSPPLPGNLIGYFDEMFTLQESYKPSLNNLEWQLVVISPSKNFNGSVNLNPINISITLPYPSPFASDTKLQVLDENRNVIINDLRTTSNFSFTPTTASTSKKYYLKVITPSSGQQKLFITNIEPSNIISKDWGQNAQYEITVKDGNGNLIDGAFLNVIDGMLGSTINTSSVTSNGKINYTTTVPTNKSNGTYSITFKAVKNSFTESDNVLRQINVNHSNIGTNQVLTLNSSNPSSGINVTVSPNDISGNGSGTTPLNRTYLKGTSVNVSAPSRINGNDFYKWQKNNLDLSTSSSITINMDNDYKLTAVYKNSLPTGPLDFSWEPKANLVEAKYGSTAIVFNDNIYLIGGSNSFSHYMYNPYDNTFQKLNEPPNSGVGSDGGSVLIDSKIYSFNTTDLDIYIFDPITGYWGNGSKIPTLRTGVNVCSVDGKAYIIGGLNVNGTALNLVEMYNPQTNQWTTKASMITSRSYASAVELNGLIYIIGGRNDNSSPQIKKNVEVYNPSNNTWTTKSSMSTARLGAAICVLNDKIYVIGGFDGANYLNIVEEYTHETDTWRKLTPISNERMDASAAVVNNQILVIGGRVSNGNLTSIEEGTAVLPNVYMNLSQTELNFGSVSKGNSAQLSFMVVNDSKSTASLSYTIDSPQNPFSIVSSHTSLDLDPGVSTLITIKFQPTDELEYNIPLTLNHNSINNEKPKIINLIGKGLNLSTNETWENIGEMKTASNKRLYNLVTAGNKVYAGGIGEIVVFDQNTKAEIGSINFPNDQNYQIGSMVIQNGKLFATIKRSEGKVAVVDLNNNNSVQYVSAGNDPYGIAFYNNNIYVTNSVVWINGNPSTVRVIAVNSLSVIKTINVGILAHSICISSAHAKAYVSNMNSNTVSVINLNTNSVIKTIQVDQYPNGITFSNNKVYVTCRMDNFSNGKLVVIDPNTDNILTNIVVGNLPSKITGGDGLVYVADTDYKKITLVNNSLDIVQTNISTSYGPTGVYYDELVKKLYTIYDDVRSINIFEKKVYSYSITGYVKNSNGSGIADVYLYGLPTNPSTDANGYFSDIVTPLWTGTITPNKASYTFSPQTYDVSSISSNMVINFTGTLEAVSITGKIIDNDGNGIDGVSLVGLPGGPQSNSDGTYQGLVSFNWNGSVSPQKKGYIFSPASRNYSSVITNKSNENFSASKIILELTAPIGNDNYATGSTQKISWLSKNVTSIRIEYSTDNSLSWNLIALNVDATKSFYNWTVPNTPSTYCLVRIIDNNDPTNVSISNNNFAISIVLSADDNIIPTEYKLLQNYPNPFNPSTTIKFSIPNSQFVTLKVYDMLGREITALVNEEKLAGNYEVKFDGSTLPSGVYFYRIQAGSFSQTKKLLLLK